MPQPENQSDNLAPKGLNVLGAKTIEGGEVEEIEGGEIEEFADIEVKTRRVREATARTIAIALIWILGLSALIHYTAVFVLELSDKPAGVEELNRFFNVWLPVVSGLVGSATTYYFTRDRS
jgi:hypothetical protein